MSNPLTRCKHAPDVRSKRSRRGVRRRRWTELRVPAVLRPRGKEVAARWRHIVHEQLRIAEAGLGHVARDGPPSRCGVLAEGVAAEDSEGGAHDSAILGGPIVVDGAAADLDRGACLLSTGPMGEAP